MKKLLAIAALLFCSLAQAGGSFMNAQALVTRLQMADPLAVGYIMGIADAEDGKTMPACWRQPHRPGPDRDTVGSTWNSKPARFHVPAGACFCSGHPGESLPLREKVLTRAAI